MKKISARQEGILEYIRNFLDNHQYPPTVRDIQSGCNISSTSVVDYNLRILQREGIIRRYPDVSRGIELVDNSRKAPASDVVDIPVLGTIAAGQPIPIPSDESWNSAEPLDILEVPASMIRGRTSVYALRVKGQSMIDALIDDGDVVVLQHTRHAESGEMVAAWLKGDNEATLKRFYLEGDRVRLQPANSTMDPIVVPAEDVEVHGRVIGIVRSYV